MEEGKRVPIAENIKGMVDSFYRSIPKYPEGKRMPLIVGFGHRARQGKDTCVNHLVQTFNSNDLRVQRYSFAETLKGELYDWFAAHEVMFKPSFTLAALRPMPTNDIQKKLQWFEAGRDALRKPAQLYGTEFRRAQDKDYWVKRTKERILADAPVVALISDIRFLNECEICDVTVAVKREGYVSDMPSHASETELDDYPYDFVLTAKDGDLDGLRRQAVELFDKILFEHRILVR